jgi:7-cyano-7-deazaguanine reductase
MVKPEGRTFPIDGAERIAPEQLETFPYEFPDREAEVVVATDEWTCVCPFSGLPDFGTLTIRYVPKAACLELKALKYYLTSFRTVGIYQEHAANRLLEDLVAACKPRRMEVQLDYRLRGGIHTVVTVRYEETGTGYRAPGTGQAGATDS